MRYYCMQTSLSIHEILFTVIGKSKFLTLFLFNGFLRCKRRKHKDRFFRYIKKFVLCLSHIMIRTQMIVLSGILTNL